MAIRIQRKRVRHWRMPSNAIYVGRPTRFGNPFALKLTGSEWAVIDRNGNQRGPAYKDIKEAKRRAIFLFEMVMRIKLKEDPNFLNNLIGKDLACWCPCGEPCHAEVLLDLLKEVTL